MIRYNILLIMYYIKSLFTIRKPIVIDTVNANKLWIVNYFNNGEHSTRIIEGPDKETVKERFLSVRYNSKIISINRIGNGDKPQN